MGMAYEVMVKGYFDAAHFLRGYPGKCERVHGHRYKVIVKVAAEELSEIGIAYDFPVLRRRLNEVIGKLDHTLLNDAPPFDRINPSAENIARFVYQEIDEPRISSVQVWESPGSGVTYRP
jgi:6-pyruvoyltetrahydropterin/6-carboxytetrahydropterin synthase